MALFGWFLYLGITDKWRRYFVSDVTPGWFWFSVFWQALWALVRLLIANIVRRPVRESNFATPSTRRDVHTGRQVRAAPPVHRPAAHE